VIDPIFWLGLSILLVAISLTALLVVAIPALQQLGRAARSAEKLFDTLHRELPPTLEAIRLTGLEISELTDDMSQGVQSAGQVVKQVDQGITGVKQQVQKANFSTRSLVVGMKAAWRSFTQPTSSKSRRSDSSFRDTASDRLPTTPRSSLLSGEPRRSAIVESIDYQYRQERSQNGTHVEAELERSLAELESELERHHTELAEMNRAKSAKLDENGSLTTKRNPEGADDLADETSPRQPVRREQE
jgi:uncharacterized protein YoxC